MTADEQTGAGTALALPPRDVDLSAPLRAAGSERGVRLAVRGSDRTVRVSSTAYFLLRCAEDGLSLDEVTAAVTRRSGSVVSTEQVASAYAEVLSRLEGVLARRPKASRLIWGRRPLLPPDVVATLARPVVGLFHPVGLTALGLGVAFVVAAFVRHPLPPPGASDVAVGYLVFLLGLLLHELGHAAAVLRAGQRPGAVGVLVYGIWPAFYTDVTVSWRLTRAERVRVDLGGVVAQLAWTEGVAVVYLVRGDPVLGYALLLALFSIGFTLNPFLKFDGYWVLTDALAVDDLNASSLAMLSARLRGTPVPAELTGSPRFVRALLTGYPAVSVMAWVVLLAWSVVGLVDRLAHLPDDVALAGSTGAAGLRLLVTVFLIVTMLAAAVLGSITTVRQARRLLGRPASA